MNAPTQPHTPLLGGPSKGRALSNRTPSEKAAAVLALLDPETLQQLTGRLPERHRDRLLAAVKNLRMVDVQEQKRIAQEFAQDVARGRNAVRGNDNIAERLKTTLFKDPNAEPDPEPEVIEEVEETGDKAATVWDKVAEFPASTLVKFFDGKSSSVLSVAMCCLPDDLVSELVGELDEAAVKAAMVHLASNGDPNPVAITAVENLLTEELLESDEPVAEAEGGGNADKVAGYLNRMISSRRDAVLEALESELSDDDIAAIRAKVLSFPALESRLPRSAIPMILREIDEKTLFTALKYGGKKDKAVVDYLLGNISQRMAGQYREQMEEMPEVEEEAGEKAQSTLIVMILSMADDGKIELITAEE